MPTATQTSAQRRNALLTAALVPALAALQLAYMEEFEDRPNDDVIEDGHWVVPSRDGIRERLFEMLEDSVDSLALKIEGHYEGTKPDSGRFDTDDTTRY